MAKSKIKYDPETGEQLFKYGSKYYTHDDLMKQLHSEAVLARVQKHKEQNGTF